MNKNIFKLAVRSLLKQKQTSIINIVGLVLAFLTLSLITLWVAGEFSYDRHHSKAERIYRLSLETGTKEAGNYWHFARNGFLWRRELPNYFPEVECIAELAPCKETIFRLENNKFSEIGFAVKESIFNVFDIELVEGDYKSALVKKHSLIISERLANKYFKGDKVIGKALNLEGSYIDKEAVYEITGIFKDFPNTSHFQSDFFVYYNEPVNENITEWAYTYLLLKEGASIKGVEDKIDDFKATHVPEGYHNYIQAFHFTPLTDIHLHSHIEREIQQNGDIKHVKLFIFVALGIFVVALVNFLNLMSASLGKRMSVFTLNIIIGGKRKHNIQQIAIEAIILSFLSLVITLGILFPVIHIMNSSGFIISLSITSVGVPYITLILLVALVLVVSTSILPYFLLQTKSNRLQQNKSTVIQSSKTTLYNKPLLVLQFAISMLVIIGSIVIKKQNNYLFSKSLGGTTKNVVHISRSFWSEENDLLRFRNEINQNPNIAQFATVMEEPSSLVKDARQVKTSLVPGGYSEYAYTIIPADGELFSLFEIPLVAGRTMKPYVEGQQFEEYILNESAVKHLGFKKPQDIIGADFTVNPYSNNDVIKGGKVVGVAKDFHFTSLYHPIQPTVFFHKPIWQWEMLVKFHEGNFETNITSLKACWQNVFPEYPFEYVMLSDTYNKVYQKDLIVNKLLNLFAILCIVISSIGLFGITSIILLNKIKEIGIRKVNGATIKEVMLMLNKEFVVWVFIAFIVACPLAWHLMHRWLENYAYRITINWWIYALAGIAAVLVALLTVSWQSFKTASRNPVEALRYE